MYIPEHFKTDDIEQQHEIIRNFPLAIMISVESSLFHTNPIPVVTHLPFFLSSDGKTLVAHLAKENEHWKVIEKNSKVLIIFNSVDSYISPSWYPTKVENPRVVPTWNFATVHVHGDATILHADTPENKEKLLKTIDKLIVQEENKRPKDVKTWELNEAPQNYLDGKLNKIVGIEISIEKLESKFKLDQMRSVVDCKGLVEAFNTEVKGEKGELMAHYTAKNYPGGGCCPYSK